MLPLCVPWPCLLTEQCWAPRGLQAAYGPGPLAGECGRNHPSRKVDGVRAPLPPLRFP